MYMFCVTLLVLMEINLLKKKGLYLWVRLVDFKVDHKNKELYIHYLYCYILINKPKESYTTRKKSTTLWISCVVKFRLQLQFKSYIK